MTSFGLNYSGIASVSWKAMALKC